MPKLAPAPRLIFGVLLAVLLGVVAAVAFRRGAALEYDFHYFYRDAAYVWSHGALNPALPDLSAAMDGEVNRERRQLPFYLPVVPVLLAPMAGLGVVGAAAAWAALHVAALGLAIRNLRYWASLGVVTAAVGLMLPAIIEATRFNQVSFVVLALVVIGVDGVLRGRATLGGVLLGLATVLKLMPGVFLIWLALKREWRALGVALGAGAVVAVLPCLLVFGPQRTWAYYREWVAYNLPGSGAGVAAPELREHFTDYRNQSIAAVVGRLGFPEHPQRVRSQPLNLSREACARLALGIAAGLGGGLIWATRRPVARLSLTQARCEAAVFGLAMLVVAPLLRQYYLIWALPGLVMLLAAGFGVRGGGGSSDSPERIPTVGSASTGLRTGGGALAKVCGWVGLGLWFVGMVAWVSPVARAHGAHIAMLIAIGSLLLTIGALQPRLNTNRSDPCAARA